MSPLNNLFVLDFSTLLPGPLASLMLAEAGAEVVKIERPGGGDAMRAYDPVVDGEGVNFALLNRGKRSITIDLKSPDVMTVLGPLIDKADILIEQFRPGVMERLGLSYQALHERNQRLIYCSISGWGQNGPKASKPGHDLNFAAESGILGLTTDKNGHPVLSAFLAGDIAGGALPAVLNILLALRQRDHTGQGCYIDVGMTDNLMGYLSWGLSSGFAGLEWPKPASNLVIGASPRYQVYRTADDRFLAAAPIEDKFWVEFTSIIGLPPHLADPGAPVDEAVDAITERIRMRTAAEWDEAFSGKDVCVSIVLTLEEAITASQGSNRLIQGRTLGIGRKTLPALPVPINSAFRSPYSHAFSPRFDESGVSHPAS